MKTLSLFLCLFLVSCSSTKIQSKIDQKVASESSVSDGKTLSNSVHEVIKASTTLDDKQKSELNVLFQEIGTKNKALLEQSYKLRSVLIKELLAGEVNTKEINMLKKDIKEAESMRLKSTFEAIDRITQIIGKNADAHMYAEHLMYMDRIR